jgi:hypothetical protein
MMISEPVSQITRDKWKEKIETILEAYNYGCIELNDWEHQFIDSVYGQVFGEERDLTFKQSSALSKIYEKVL